MKTADFEFVRQLDSGSFGSIHLVCRKSDDKKFVIKQQGKYYDYAQNEEMIMKKLRHPNVLGYYGSWEEAHESQDNEQNENNDNASIENEECEENDVYRENKEKEENLENEGTVETKENEIDDEQDQIDEIQENEVYVEAEGNEGDEENKDDEGSSSKYYILMEYISGGTLSDLLNEAYYDGRTAMKENEALYFFSQLALGLDHLHSQGIIHRDIKPENIMFAGPLKKVKIIDFGLSRDVSEETDVQMVNPNDYTAPENFSDDVPYTFESDIWSIATLLYEVVTGYRPEHLENRLDVLEDLPPSVGTVCKSIMKVEPSERPESHEVIKYPELMIWMRKYYRGLVDEEDREIVKLQLHNIIDCDDN